MEIYFLWSSFKKHAFSSGILKECLPDLNQSGRVVQHKLSFLSESYSFHGQL